MIVYIRFKYIDRISDHISRISDHISRISDHISRIRYLNCASLLLGWLSALGFVLVGTFQVIILHSLPLSLLFHYVLPPSLPLAHTHVYIMHTHTHRTMWYQKHISLVPS